MSQIKRYAEQAIEDLLNATPEQLQEVWDRVNPVVPSFEHSIISSIVADKDIDQLAHEYFLMKQCLIAIEEFGHKAGHARGYTCANMAQQVLKLVNV